MPVVFRTEEDLAGYLARLNPDLVESLGWTVEEGSYDEILAEVYDDMGTTDVSAMIDMRKLRIVMKYRFWEYVLTGLAGNRFNFSGDGGSISYSQIFDQAKTMFSLASTDAAAYGLGVPRVKISRVIRQDIYRPFTAEDLGTGE